MNWADWTFRCSDGTEYAIDAEGNVQLPEGRKITKGESFTVGLRNAPNVVRIPDGVALNPERRPHYAVADFVKMRVEAPGWHEGTDGYFLSGERIDPRTVYFECGNVRWNSSADLPSPYVVYRDPQTRLTRVAAAVKIALDGSVN